ncbi:MAG: sugar ABC transporter substrate-binding protein [Anaerolineales bacterium]|nr:sugar ABC transporter substrate-binding protein [Anaerolineales bacterium]
MTKDNLSRRDFLRMSGLVAASAVLAACAPTAGPSTQEPAQEEEEEGAPAAPKSATVRFFTNDVGWREERYRSILPDFEAEFPHIKIEYTHVTADWEEALTTWAAAGTMPDVFYSRTQKTASRARLGWILPITEYINADPDRDALLDDFWPVQVPQLQYKGDWYLIPENISAISFKFRTEFFEEAGIPYPEKPWTMEEFKTICEQVTVRESDETTRWAFDPSWFLTSSGFAWIWLPAGIVDTETNTCVIDQPENIEMLNFLQDMKFKDKLIPRSEDIPEGINMFANDRVAIMQAGVWEVTDVRDSLGEDKHWDIAWLPNNPMKPEENLSINYGAGYAMGKDSPDKDAAWTLLRYLSRPEMQQVFIVEDNWALPGRMSVTEDWINGVLNTGSGEPEHVRVWHDALLKGRTVPVTPAEKELEDQYPNLMGPILVTGEQRAEEALPGIQAELQAILDKYAD